MNVVPIRILRSFAGKAANISTLIFMWRPFLRMVWAALAEAMTKQSGAPPNCAWVKTCSPTLKWIDAFLKQERQLTGTDMLIRTYYLKNHITDRNIRMSIITDASPWGLGGILTVGTNIIAYYTSPLTNQDEEIFGHTIGEAHGQQSWESLACYVAVRLWLPLWKGRRIKLEMRSDSVSALNMMLNLRSKGYGSNLIAQEMALLIAAGEFSPDVLAHTPGVCNIIPDHLSRMYIPDKAQYAGLPAGLGEARRCEPEQRVRGYYKTLR
jgi:hypothetical protein